MRGKVEDRFRYMAFTVYYRKLENECDDLTARFVMAVVRSARPVPEGKQSLIVKWWKERRSIHGRTEDEE